MLQGLSRLLQQHHESLLLIDSAIIGFAVLWQYYLIFSVDRYTRGSAHYFLPKFIANFVPNFVPKRAVLPYLFGIFIIIGVAYYTYQEFGQNHIFKQLLFVNIKLSTEFFLIIAFKAWFGPLLLAISITSVLHQLAHGHQNFMWMPDFIQDMMDPIFEHLPKSIYIIYVIISLIYVAGSSILDTVTGAHH